MAAEIRIQLAERSRCAGLVLKYAAQYDGSAADLLEAIQGGEVQR